jgi:DNA-binding NtrC family response regulator
MAVRHDHCATWVLLIDDDLACLHGLADLLTFRIPEIIIATCSSAQTASAHLGRNTYDLIISDIRMPGMDGLTLLRQIKAHAADTPVLLLTGVQDDAVLRAARDGGAYTVIAKPIDRDEFIQTVTEALASRRTNSQDTHPLQTP